MRAFDSRLYFWLILLGWQSVSLALANSVPALGTATVDGVRVGDSYRTVVVSRGNPTHKYATKPYAFWVYGLDLYQNDTMVGFSSGGVCVVEGRHLSIGSHVLGPAESRASITALLGNPIRTENYDDSIQSTELLFYSNSTIDLVVRYTVLRNGLIPAVRYSLRVRGSHFP